MNEPQEERNGAVNGHLLKCSSYNGSECDRGMIPKKLIPPQNRPGDGRENMEERFEKSLGYLFNEGKVSIYEIVHLQDFISQEIKLALAAYRDAIMGEKVNGVLATFKDEVVNVESIERVSGEFGI